MKPIIKIMAFLCFANTAFAQNILSPEAAVQATLQNHPLAKAADYASKARIYGERAAFNLPNPEVNVESPTGEFYALGVLQSFEFPTVYSRQKKVARNETTLTQTNQKAIENELRQRVRLLLLETQVAEYQGQLWRERDTLYRQIAEAAERQFAAGEIDFLQKTMAENEAREVQQARVAIEITTAGLYVQLKTLTGLNDFNGVQALSPDTTLILVEPALTTNPSVLYEQQAVILAESQANLAKSRTMPNFSLGYLNQGARNTPMDYRFRASVGVPLWFGQYRAGRQAAETDVRAAQSRVEAQAQAIALEKERAVAEFTAARYQVDYYHREALPRSRAITDASVRMREAGQVDYVTFLRTLDVAYSIQRDYVAQVKALNTAKVQLLYLSGQ